VVIIAAIIIAGSTSGCAATPSTPLTPMPVLSSLVGTTDFPVILEQPYEGGWLRSQGPTKNPQRLVFGDWSSGKEGIDFLATLNVSSGLDGTIEWVQNGKSDVTWKYKDGTADGWSTNGQWTLDGQTIYTSNAFQEIYPNTSGEITTSTQDSPSEELLGTMAEFYIKQDYRMYLMWRPRGATDDARTPIAKFEWSWDVTAENQSSDSEYYDWKIVGNPGWSPMGSSLGMSTTEMPVLSPNMRDFTPWK